MITETDFNARKEERVFKIDGEKAEVEGGGMTMVFLRT